MMLRLLAVVPLPMVLPVMIFAPAVTWMPASDTTLPPVPAWPLPVMEPMALFEIATRPLLAEATPKPMEKLEGLWRKIEPVPVPLPIVLPLVVPMFAEPAAT